VIEFNLAKLQLIEAYANLFYLNAMQVYNVIVNESSKLTE